MARINVEDSFFSDPRFRLLVKHIGDEPKAVGLCVQAWLLAQRYWVNDRCLIPEKLWKTSGLEALTEVDLAEYREEGVYCRGSEKQFKWLEHGLRAAAGRKSAKARRSKYGTAIPLKARNAPPADTENTEQTPNTTEQAVRKCSKTSPNSHRTKPNSLTLTLSPTLPLTHKTLSPNGERGRQASPRIPYQTFFELWNAHRGTLPRIETLTDPRKAKIKARWSKFPDLAYWESCIRKMAASTFCCESAWASFDWLIKNDANHVKVAEGNYDNREGGDKDEIDWSKVFGEDVPK